MCTLAQPPQQPPLTNKAIRYLPAFLSPGRWRSQAVASGTTVHDGRNVECLRVVPHQDDDFAHRARQGHRNDAQVGPLHQGSESQADSVAEQEQDVSI